MQKSCIPEFYRTKYSNVEKFNGKEVNIRAAMLESFVINFRCLKWCIVCPSQSDFISPQSPWPKVFFNHRVGVNPIKHKIATKQMLLCSKELTTSIDTMVCITM